MTGFGINPPRAPITDGKGMVTTEWYRFFVQLQRVVGGPSSPFDDGYFLTAGQGNPVVSSGDELGFPAPTFAAPPEDSIAAPVYAPAPEDALPPPPIVIVMEDDLLYPPRYGA